MNGDESRRLKKQKRPPRPPGSQRGRSDSKKTKLHPRKPVLGPHPESGVMAASTPPPETGVRTHPRKPVVPLYLGRVRPALVLDRHGPPGPSPSSANCPGLRRSGGERKSMGRPSPSQSGRTFAMKALEEAGAAASSSSRKSSPRLAKGDQGRYAFLAPRGGPVTSSGSNRQRLAGYRNLTAGLRTD